MDTQKRNPLEKHILETLILVVILGCVFLISLSNLGDFSTIYEKLQGTAESAPEHPEKSAVAEKAEELGKDLPIWSGIPFVGILLSISLFPLFLPHFWHNHFPKISAAWSLALAIPFLFAYGEVAFYEICHIYFADYIPFIILLWSLFTISGGILFRANLKATPFVNTTFILVGTILASWVGTTGASMLLIRPLLKINAKRKNKVYIIIFFIFLVSNIGGSLTPLGDPPLFLGFLHSVPFFWTMNLLPHMGLLSALLLIIFFFLDRHYYKKEIDEDREPEKIKAKVEIRGLYNFLFLGGVVGAVLMSGIWHAGEVTILGVHRPIQDLIRDLILTLMGLLSLYYTPKKIRVENEFTWFPIKEVAYLFAGIFMTIVPVLSILKAGEEGSLGFLIKSVKEPVHYFWVTGILSSFLDNAPTYLTFFNSALGRFFPGVPEAAAVKTLITQKKIYLEAISTGAVFMGANTYIGNAPNFMVKSIAEESGIRMPSFFGYIAKYTLPILVPLFILISLVFFR